MKKIYVARTVELPQANYEQFLNSAARRLGCLATVTTAGGTHITLLDSGGTTHGFRRHGYTPRDINSFSSDMQQHLDDVGLTDEIVVTVDPEIPIRWIGDRVKKMALNILPDERLQQERDNIEAFLAERFGHVPRLRPFDPHITIADTNSRIKHPERDYPDLLFSRGNNSERVDIPSQIALNGLMVYADQIED